MCIRDRPAATSAPLQGRTKDAGLRQPRRPCKGAQKMQACGSLGALARAHERCRTAAASAPLQGRTSWQAGRLGGWEAGRLRG
eukprot:11014901-Heterocapsa_arctica.AAC.1